MKKMLVLLVIVALVVYYLSQEQKAKQKPSIKPACAINSPLSSLPSSFKKPFIPAQSTSSREEIITKKSWSTALINLPLNQPNEPKMPVLNTPVKIMSNPDDYYRLQLLNLLDTWQESFTNLQQKSKVVESVSLLQASNKPRWEYLQSVWGLRGMEGWEFYLKQSLQEWVNLPVKDKPAEAPVDYGWLTDDNLEFILRNSSKIQTALRQQRQFYLRTDLANVYNAFYKAKSKQDWPLPEFLQELEWNKVQCVLLPLRVNGNHWGLVVLEDKGDVYEVYYTSSGGGSLESEKEQLKPFISQICGEVEIKVIEPEDRESKGYECGVYLVKYVEEVLETGKLELKRTYSAEECQEFRWEWKERVGGGGVVSLGLNG